MFRMLAASALTLAVAIGITSCTGAPPRVDAASSEAFWAHYRAVSTAEVDAADSLAELVSRSNLIVLGSVTSVNAGPSDVYTLDDGSVVEKTSTVLTVDSSSTLAGAPVAEVRVWLSAEGPSEAIPSSTAVPDAEFVWFLRPSDEEGLHLMTTVAGIVGLDDDGTLATLRAPEASVDVVPPGVQSMEAFESTVNELVRS